jgi:hypothetical protein
MNFDDIELERHRWMIFVGVQKYTSELNFLPRQFESMIKRFEFFDKRPATIKKTLWEFEKLFELCTNCY